MDHTKEQHKEMLLAAQSPKKKKVIAAQSPTKK